MIVYTNISASSCRCQDKQHKRFFGHRELKFSLAIKYYKTIETARASRHNDFQQFQSRYEVTK